MRANSLLLSAMASWCADNLGAISVWLCSSASLVLGSANEKKMVCTRSCNRSEEHPSELRLLMRISYAVFSLKHKTAALTAVSSGSHSVCANYSTHTTVPQHVH